MAIRENLRPANATASPAGQVLVCAAGDLDMASAEHLVRRVDAALREDAAAMLVLDLADVNFIDSSGISALLLSRRAALSAGRSFRVANITSPVRRMLQLAGVATVLAVDDDGVVARSEDPEQEDSRSRTASPFADSAVRDAFSSLSHHFIGDATMTETLQRIIEITLSAIPVADHASIGMTVDGRIRTQKHSDPRLAEVDRLQHQIGEGPTVDAILAGELVLIRSTRADVRYPRFRQAAHQHGIRTVLALPMRTKANVIGALNLYSSAEDAFSASDIEVGSTFATQAAFVLANAQAYWDARTLSENLTQAMQSRAEIEQAKGIIMATAGVSADAAFEQLVRQSQHENIKVRDLAMEVVRRAQRNRRP